MLSLCQIWATQTDPVTGDRGALTVRFHLQSSFLTALTKPGILSIPPKIPAPPNANLSLCSTQDTWGCSEHPDKAQSVLSTPGT